MIYTIFLKLLIFDIKLLKQILSSTDDGAHVSGSTQVSTPTLQFELAQWSTALRLFNARLEVNSATDIILIIFLVCFLCCYSEI